MIHEHGTYMVSNYHSSFLDRNLAFLIEEREVCRCLLTLDDDCIGSGNLRIGMRKAADLDESW